MKKNLIIFSVVAFLIVGLLILAGCGEKKDEGIVGSWSYNPYGSTEYIYTFNADKTGSYSAGGTAMDFTYEDDGTKVSILYTGNTVASSYEYRIEEGKKLFIKDSFGSELEYDKK